MTCYRANTHVLSLETETAFGTLNGAPAPAGIPCWEMTLPWKRATIEDQATRQSLGSRPPLAGTDFEVGELAFSCYAYGSGSLVSPPPETPLSQMLEAVCGESMRIVATDAVAGIPTTTAVPLAIGAGYVEGEIYLAPFEVDGSAHRYIRPAQYSTVVTPTLTLFMALPLAPTAVTDEVSAHMTLGCIDGTGPSVQGTAVGMVEDDGVDMLGICGGNLSIPPLKPSDAQTLTFSAKVGAFSAPTTTPTASRTTPAHLSEVKPSAGAELLIGAFGSTAHDRLDNYMISIETGREYIWKTISGVDNPLGVQGVCLVAQNVAVTVVVYVGDTPPAALTGNTWREVFALGEHVQLLASYGVGVPGEMFSAWLPKLHLTEDPEPGDQDGIATWTLKFANSESTLDALYLGLA